MSTYLSPNPSFDVAAVVPCKNESASIERVITELLTGGVMRVVVGLDPTCSDDTRSIAERAGATVVDSMTSGYDGPVLTAVSELANAGFNGRVLFLDAGNKYDIASVLELLKAASPTADMTFGIRDTHMFWHQRLGNALFCGAVRVRFRHTVADVSSVRLIPMSVVQQLRLVDRTVSLPFQTIVNGLRIGATIAYVPIRCLPRVGVSKISGSKRMTLRVANQMLQAFVQRPTLTRLR